MRELLLLLAKKGGKNEPSNQFFLPICRPRFHFLIFYWYSSCIVLVFESSSARRDAARALLSLSPFWVAGNILCVAVAGVVVGGGSGFCSIFSHKLLSLLHTPTPPPLFVHFLLFHALGACRITDSFLLSLSLSLSLSDSNKYPF